MILFMLYVVNTSALNALAVCVDRDMPRSCWHGKHFSPRFLRAPRPLQSAAESDRALVHSKVLYELQVL